MALTRTNRDNKVTSTSVLTSNAFTPSNNSLLVVIAQTANQSNTPPDDVNMVITDSLGTLTWTKRISADATGGTIFSPIIGIWTAPIVTGASMTVTITYSGGGGNQNGGCIAIVDYTGYDTASPTGATAVDPNLPEDGAASITLSAPPLATSEVIAQLGHGVGATGNLTATPGAGWTELYDQFNTDNAGHQVQVRSGSTSTTVAWVDVESSGTAGGAYDTLAVAVEIREAPSVFAYDTGIRTNLYSPNNRDRRFGSR